MRFLTLVSIQLGLTLASSCSRPAPPPSPLPVSPLSGTARWEWDYRDQLTHVLVLIVEQSSGRLRQAYTLAAGVPPCGRPAIPDSTFLARAVGFLRAVGWDMISPGQQTVGPFGLEFVRVNAYAGDFAADVIFHKDGGMVFAGTEVWTGSGGRYFPSLPVDWWLVKDTDSLAPRPAAMSLVTPVPDSVVASVRRLNIVRALAARPYYLTAFEHNKEMQPVPYDVDWVFFLVRRGTCY